MFRLALSLHWPSVAWGLAHISARELAEWEAYYRVEPWGEERADLRAGIIAATEANVHRDAKKRRKAFTPEEFMPRFTAQGKKQTPEQTRAFAQMMAAAGYGRFTDGDAG